MGASSRGTECRVGCAESKLGIEDWNENRVRRVRRVFRMLLNSEGSHASPSLHQDSARGSELEARVELEVLKSASVQLPQSLTFSASGWLRERDTTRTSQRQLFLYSMLAQKVLHV